MRDLAKNPQVYTDFESGNFIADQVSHGKIVGRIKKDANDKDFQWFHFDIAVDQLGTIHVCINDILQSSYPTAWYKFKVAIFQKNKWAFESTQLKGSDLCFDILMREKRVKVAYFIPFSLKQHSIISDRIKGLPYLEQLYEVTTSKNNTLQIFKLSNKNSKTKKNLWIIARQHAGETIVGWFMDGIISAFTLPSRWVDVLFSQFNVFIIHNANPDGVSDGAHRTTAEGIDLNRDWLNTESIEVKTIKNYMNLNPPNIFLDLHGDERTTHPYVLTNSPLNLHVFGVLTDCIPVLEIRSQNSTNSDLSIGRNFIEKYFTCLSLTLELPCQMQSDYNGDIIQSTQTMATAFIQSFTVEAYENFIHT